MENLLGIKVTQSAISQAKLRVTKLGTPLRTAYDDIRTEIQQSAVVNQAELARQDSAGELHFPNFFPLEVFICHIERSETSRYAQHLDPLVHSR